jgi:two-component system nitrate/nitrite response regulator NarL
MTEPVTIYLADDHQIVVDGLKLLISTEENIKIIGSANDGDTACKEIIAKKPDLALLDLRMPGMSGLELVYKLSKLVPDTKVIILSMQGDPRDIRDAMNGGAAGYLLKNTGQAALIACLSAVIRGEKYFPNLPKAKSTTSKPLFTPRELDILKLVLEEYTTAQIAEQLSLSPLTVETHRKNICRKTDTNTSIGLIRFLQDNHIEV